MAIGTKAMSKLHLLLGSIRKRGLGKTLAYVFYEYYFDLRYGVETATIVDLAELPVIGQSREHGSPYQAANYLALRRAFSKLRDHIGQVDPSKTFLDFGCGKGRAMMVAMEYGFRHLVGVEFADALIQVCEKNLKHYAMKTGMGSRVDWLLVHEDAAQYAIPPDAAFIFFYNPFDCEIIDRVIENIAMSLSMWPRDVLVIYVNPVCRDSFLRHGYLEVLHDPYELSLLVPGPRQ